MNLAICMAPNLFDQDDEKDDTSRQRNEKAAIFFFENLDVLGCVNLCICVWGEG